MLRKLVIFGICAGASASFPILYQAMPDKVAPYLADKPKLSEISMSAEGSGKAGARSSTVASAGSGRKVTLEGDERGHFVGDFKLNGRKIVAMVDTGASAVAINMSTARKIGIAINTSDLNRTVSTANGSTRAAVVTIDRLDIGRISVDNVEAVVLEDKALGGTLIGMTFLNRLKTFQANEGALTLVQ